MLGVWVLAYRAVYLGGAVQLNSLVRYVIGPNFVQKTLSWIGIECTRITFSREQTLSVQGRVLDS